MNGKFKLKVLQYFRWYHSCQLKSWVLTQKVKNYNQWSVTPMSLCLRARLLLVDIAALLCWNTYFLAEESSGQGMCTSVRYTIETGFFRRFDNQNRFICFPIRCIDAFCIKFRLKILSFLTNSAPHCSTDSCCQQRPPFWKRAGSLKCGSCGRICGLLTTYKIFRWLIKSGLTFKSSTVNTLERFWIITNT